MTPANPTPEFFRRFAHDLTNALAGVRGALDILASRAAEGPDAEFARAAINDLTRADALIHDAATYASPPPLDTRTVEVSRLIDETLHQVEPLTRSSGVRLDLTCIGTVIVEADVAQLARALAEVVRNAAEAVTPAATVGVTGSLNDHAVLITVTSGAPTATPIDARAFEPLWTTKRGHAGLGLSIAQRVVEAHGGSVELDGSEQGTTVRVRLPMCQAEQS